MEQLSNVLLRSHTILTLFDKDRFQIHYYDRSAIVLSSIVSLSTPEGQALFILMLMGLRRLTSEDFGLRDVLTDSGKFYKELITSRKITQGSSKELAQDVPRHEAPIDSETYTLQEILFRQPGIVGRTTCVVAAEDSKGKEVVVKISCPVDRRQSEVDLIARARTHAEGDEGHKWALKHLPRVFASVDFPLASVQRRICEFINSTETQWVGGKTLFYESRILRITVFEKLRPLLEAPQSFGTSSDFL
ncbi:hypothetical protein CPB85DRAFT_876404 [Mucidula mucida]|nr:hypothetical protein CPB85DRAFT_876404 [Mucidula mucida]